MSRIGKKPVPIPPGVKVAVKERVLEVEGKKSKLTSPIPSPSARAAVTNAPHNASTSNFTFILHPLWLITDKRNAAKLMRACTFVKPGAPSAQH